MKRLVVHVQALAPHALEREEEADLAAWEEIARRHAHFDTWIVERDLSPEAVEALTPELREALVDIEELQKLLVSEMSGRVEDLGVRSEAVSRIILGMQGYVVDAPQGAILRRRV